MSESMTGRSRILLRGVLLKLPTIAVLIAIALASGLAPLAADPRADVATGSSAGTNPGEQVAVHLRILSSSVDDHGVHGNTDQVGSADVAVVVGRSAGVYVAFGGFDATGKAEVDSCASQLGSAGASTPDVETKRKLLDSYSDLWWADIKVLPATFGQVSLEVTWDHVASEAKGRPVSIKGDTRRIGMNEGESHLLDAFTFEKSGCSRDRTVLFEVSADIQEDPAFAGDTISYDLWLKHTDRAGVVTARRFQAAGRQGENLEFRFVPMRFPVPGKILNDGSTLDSILASLGAIRGRLRSDGTISLDVGITRWIGAAAVGDPRTGGWGAGGRKQVTVAAGETVSLVLPSPGGGPGYGYYDRTKSAQAHGVAVEDPNTVPRTIYVNNREFYAGHTDELILTARPAK